MGESVLVEVACVLEASGYHQVIALIRILGIGIMMSMMDRPGSVSTSPFFDVIQFLSNVSHINKADTFFYPSLFPILQLSKVYFPHFGIFPLNLSTHHPVYVVMRSFYVP